MSLAYGVEGELTLLLENNYGDYYNWDERDVLEHIDMALQDMWHYSTDLKETKKIKLLMDNEAKKKKIAKAFMKEKREDGGMKK